MLPLYFCSTLPLRQPQEGAEVGAVGDVGERIWYARVIYWRGAGTYRAFVSVTDRLWRGRWVRRVGGGRTNEGRFAAVALSYPRFFSTPRSQRLPLALLDALRTPLSTHLRVGDRVSCEHKLRFRVYALSNGISVVVVVAAVRGW